VYLAELKIENFRGIKSARLVLKRCTLLIGSNNVGKTTVLEAAALLLGRDRMVIEPCEWDFYNGWMFEEDAGGEGVPSSNTEASRKISADGKAADGKELEGEELARLTPIRIRVTGVLADLNRDERRLLCHPSRAGAIGSWNPKEDVFAAREAQAGEEPAVRVAFEAHYDVEEGEVISKRFFPVDGEDPLSGDPTEPLRRQHIQMAGYFLLSSTRVWRDAVRFTSSIFGSLLRQQQVRTGEQVRRIAKSLEGLQPKAHDADELSELLKGLRETVGRFITISPEDPLGFEVTELSSPDVERALTLFLRGTRDERPFPMSRHGSATVSVQILAMLVMLGKHRRERNLSFLLGLEEPELHLHPHAQRNLVSAAREDATQLIVSTHSPAITECFKPDEVCVLATQDGQLTGRYLLTHDVKKQTKNLIKRWVFVRRRRFAEALMSPAVLLVEGETEADLLPALSTLINGAGSLDELGCTVVQCGGSELPKVLPMFERFAGIRIVLLDGDSAGDDYVEQILALQTEHQPHLLLRLPKDEAIERSLAHGLDEGQASRILALLVASCADICVEPPTGIGQAGLEAFLVQSKMKKNPLLRDAIADAFRSAGVAPPVVTEIRYEVAAAISTRPTRILEKRLGSTGAAL